MKCSFICYVYFCYFDGFCNFFYVYSILVVEVLMVMMDTGWYDDQRLVSQLNTGRYHD